MCKKNKSPKKVKVSFYATPRSARTKQSKTSTARKATAK
jgi:hypothetical protein